ncbi:MAG: LysR family transcriptional regulator [Pseudomonadota bacterium]
MDNWDEIRTAYQVARMGTVSGAAEVLGVHHATVIRHIDSLEQRLGVKLFQRHARGYTATEAGADLLQVAQATDDQLTQLVGRIKGRGSGVTGDLVVTTLPTLSALLTPELADFQAEHPDIVVRFLTSDRVFRLEYGEAHVAIRVGNAPDQPDNVVQAFGSASVELVAHDRYVERHGLPKDDSFDGHFFVAHDNEAFRAPFDRWLRGQVRPDQITFRASDIASIEDAVLAGAGIGFMSKSRVAATPGLHVVRPQLPEWGAPMWLVTHVDLHRTAKVQAFLSFIKERAKSWVI